MVEGNGGEGRGGVPEMPDCILVIDLELPKTVVRFGRLFGKSRGLLVKRCGSLFNVYADVLGALLPVVGHLSRLIAWQYPAYISLHETCFSYN
jgi:hypothetical protein